MQHRRCGLAWKTQEGVDCWNYNSYESVWHLGRSNSLSIWAERIILSFPDWILYRLSIPLENMIFILFVSCFGIKTNVRVLRISLTLSPGWNSNFQAALGARQGNVCVLRVSHALPAWCPAPCATLWPSSSRSNDPFVGFREAEKKWKVWAICFCALWGFSEEHPDCSLQSTTLYSLTLREMRHLRYSCNEHRVVFMLSLPRQLDCWRPDGTPRYTAVNHEYFTSPAAQSEQNQALPPKTRHCWGRSWGLPFVSN